MVDETTNLDPAGAAALEAHFLDPEAPNPARGPAGGLSRAGSGPKPGPGGNATTPSASNNATPGAPWTGGSSIPRTGTGWPGSRPTCPPTRQPGSGTGPPPPPAPSKAQPRAGPSPNSVPTTSRRGSSAAPGTAPGRALQDGTRTGCREIPSPTAQVLVTVPVFALMGLTDEPAILDGYGPIPPSMARALVANGAESFRRVLTDPRDGAPLEIGRESYRIPKALRQWLRLRDGKCQFPGCSNPSLDNEADHLNAWANGGSTGISNLTQLCPKHHRLKHTTPWQPTEATKNEPPGWISPTGRHYQSEQPDREPPHWPQPLVDDPGFAAGRRREWEETRQEITVWSDQEETDQEPAAWPDHDKSNQEETDQESTTWPDHDESGQEWKFQRKDLQRADQETGVAQDGEATADDPLGDESSRGVGVTRDRR